MTGTELIAWIDGHTDYVLTRQQREYLSKSLDRLTVTVVSPGTLQVQLSPVMEIRPGAGK